MKDISILDMKQLLKPVSKKMPAGEDIRLSSSGQTLYLKLRDARQMARTIERQSIQGIDSGVVPDWQCVFEQSLILLSNHTKDLEISAWMTEALLRLYGFAGLSEGFTLMRNYIEQYWDVLYPLPDEEGIDNRIAPLVGLNGNDTEGTLIIPLAKLPLTEGKAFSLWQYQQATALLKILPEKREQRISAGAYTIEMIEAAASETSSVFFETLLKNIQNALITFELLDVSLNEKCGADAPPTSKIYQKIKECLHAAQVISQKKILSLQTSTVQAENENKRVFLLDSVPSENVSAEILASQVKREALFESILEAAKFFRQTEPHSPLPYLLERAVKWGKTPLPTLWRELSQDQQSWEKFCHLVGISIEEK